MKTGWIHKTLSVLLAGAMMFNMAAVRAYAAEAEPGKYVSEVFVAYGKNEAEAEKWLKKNGWEPVKGDLNAGKASYFDNNKVQDQNVAAVMGIKRTDKEKDAITDMAVMNMEGGYSFPDYEELLDQKKTEINEFVDHFLVVIEEYRANLSREEGTYGKKRADLACDLLNKFIDGDPEGRYAVNDTGRHLGDLLAEETLQEGNESGGDLEQMILESSGPAMLAVEAILMLASDTAEDTWIERASGLTGDELAENLVKYAPEAEGQDVAPSAVPQFLSQKYGKVAKVLADQWSNIHDEMIWYENYNEENGLWPGDDEENEAYAARIEKYFADLKKQDTDKYEKDFQRYYTMSLLYNGLYEAPYAGDWGESMGDFFNPADGASYAEDNLFLPMAAALSDGQRAGIDLLSLQTLLIIGLGCEEGLDFITPDLEDVMGDDVQEMDLYTGVNRGAFRAGVAMTSNAFMQQNAGRGQAFDQIWDNTGIVAITTYAAGALAIVTVATGAFFTVNKKLFKSSQDVIDRATAKSKAAYDKYIEWENTKRVAGQDGKLSKEWADFQNTRGELNRANGENFATAGRWMMGIGGALLVGAAVVKGIQMWKYYDRKMKPIPTMIVDESDIVTYLTDEKTGKPLLDENGKQKKNIDFNTYEYYESVKCNRPDVGEIGDWQDGVDEYDDHGCYDVADLNCDMGQEWLALYTVKSKAKGHPVLADTLTVKYGKNKDLPEKCTKGLHLFSYTNAVDLGDTAWSFNNKKNGVRLYWGEDEKAFAANAATAFGRGHLALAGIAGLILGILGGTVLIVPRRRKKQQVTAQNETTAV